MLPLKSISPTRIKTFDMCRFKYWLTYHRPDVELKTNWGAVHGSLIHDILEFYVNGEDTDWMGRLYKGYAGTLKTLDRYGKPVVMESVLKWAKPDEFANKKPYCDSCPLAQNGKCKVSGEPLDNLTGCPKSLFEGSIRMTEDVIHRYEEDIWPNVLKDHEGKAIGCEYKFDIVVPSSDVSVIGVMDLVVDHGDSVEIIDYKTGKWTQTASECEKDVQVQIYSWAARREFIDDVNNKGYRYKNVFLTFDYFTANPVSVSLTEQEDVKTQRFILSKIREIQETDRIWRIVPDDVDFSQSKYFKCRAICDNKACEREWTGAFRV